MDSEPKLTSYIYYTCICGDVAQISRCLPIRVEAPVSGNELKKKEKKRTKTMSSEASKGTTTGFVECDRLQRALVECHRRIPAGRARESGCRHLNRGLAECLVSVACPDEAEAVRSLCGSGGTGLKRTQCQQAQLSLSVCLSSLQRQD
uniref:uncharacterized protein LOC105350359 n=1 Tax=Fragaria vesca subsp. vesca TaxID=101020 RepID=UPI0005CA94BA|nr:PREDICTED: uncharacterized protein LOC105350359 [Fragaria vesca subsp. vesca]